MKLEKETELYVFEIEVQKQKEALAFLLKQQEATAKEIERTSSCINALQTALEAIKATYRQ